MADAAKPALPEERVRVRLYVSEGARRLDEGDSEAAVDSRCRGGVVEVCREE